MQEVNRKLIELQLGQKCKTWDLDIYQIGANLFLLDQENRIRDQESREIVEWLSPLNFWAKQNDTIERRQEGTGEWLLKHPDFQKWVNGEISIVWCPGDRTPPFSSG